MDDDKAAQNIVSGHITSLTEFPAIGKSTSELLMNGVSLQKDTLTYGALSDGYEKKTLNSFLSNGDISLELDQTLQNDDPKASNKLDKK